MMLDGVMNASSSRAKAAWVVDGRGSGKKGKVAIEVNACWLRVLCAAWPELY